MKKKLTLILTLVLVCAMLLPTLASCDMLENDESEWYYRKQGDSKIYLYLDKKAETMTVLVEDEEGLVSDVFDVDIKDDEIKIKDGTKNKETYSFKEKSGSYIVINDIKFKVSEEPEDYESGDGELTIYDVFGHPDSESAVTTDPVTDTTETAEVTTKEPVRDTTVPNTSDTTRISIGIGVPANDWEGYRFRILYSTINDAQTDFICDEPKGNVLNDQVYARNVEVEQRLNISIVTTPDNDRNFVNILKQQYSVGYTEGDYDMVTGHGAAALKVAVRGHVADLTQYDEMNIHRDYWDQGYVDSFMINNKLFSLIGDYSVMANLSVSSICFNKNIIRELDLKDPYDLVKSGEWTVDALLSYMDGFAIDYGNDGFDADKDLFAITGSRSASYGLFYGVGFTFCKTDGKTIALEYDEYLLDAASSCVNALWCQGAAYSIDNTNYNTNYPPFDIFTSGRALFCEIKLNELQELSEMEDDYGILPEPKLDLNQNDYCSYVGSSVPILLIPANDPSPRRTGNIIENICWSSSELVIPKIVDVVMKAQYARDAESSKMIDIILEKKVYDPAHWLGLSGYATLSNDIVRKKDWSLYTTLQQFKPTAEAELNEFINAHK